MMHLVKHRSIPESNSSSPPDLLGLIFVMPYFTTGFESLLATGHLPWCPLPFPRTGCHSSGSAENPVRFQFSAIQKIKLSALCSFKSQILSGQLLFFIFQDLFCPLLLSPGIFLIISLLCQTFSGVFFPFLVSS